MVESSDIDGTDRRLLRALQADGRAAVTGLAETLGLSATPCLRRLKRLEETGIITGYRAEIEPRRIGLHVQAFVQVSLTSHEEKLVDSFHRALAARPEVVAAYAMSGEMDYLLHILVRDLDAYGEFAMKALLRMPGVKETRSSFVLGVPKPSTGVPV